MSLYQHSPDQITSLELLDQALVEVDNALSPDTFQAVIERILRADNPMNLALVLAATKKPLARWVLDAFPSNAAGYDASLHYKMLTSLSSTFIFHFDTKADAQFTEDHRAIQSAAKALEQLLPCAAVKPLSSPDASTSNSFFGRKKGGMSQKQMRKARRVENITLPPIDQALYLNTLLVDPPEELDDVPRVIQHILTAQKEILDGYLSYLRSPKALALLRHKSIYIPPVIVEEPIDVQSDTEPEVVVVDDLPSAYPIVRPMKSALHFDSPEGFGAWRVIIGKNAHDVLRTTHKKDLPTFDIIVKKIKDLSVGHFSGDNQKRLSGAGIDVPIYEAKMSRDLRLIYQIDLIPVEDSREQQAIKIFGIHTHAQMDHRLWDSISSQLRKKGPAYRERCGKRKRSGHADKDMFVPETYPPLPEVSALEVDDLPDLLPNDTAQVHSRLVVEKFVTFSQPFLNTVLADLDVTLPHLVSSQEKLIIENPTSCYVIGRSGTGKTTTMLFKMLLIERTHHLLGSDIPRPRQVFVTKSRMLAKKVQEYFSKLAISLNRASQTLAEMQRLSNIFVDDEDEAALIDADDVHEWRTDLPVRFSELEEKHFPLFVTYDGLCDMLEADIASTTNGKKEGGKQKSKPTLITFETFMSSYWAHFSEMDRKGLDPALVYSELIGVIKGSEESLSEPKRHLSKETYAKLSKRQHSTLSGRTDEVYALFQSYISLKMKAREYDVADRTHQIVAYFKEHGVPGAGIDHLYIDEVQDNLLIDTMVLRAICSNPNGLFWAGDTAQTISVGSSFRFDGLKAFQHRLELLHRKNQPMASIMPATDPEIFQLAINYRSHAGIVNCAHSIIDLINFFWDDSIDRLSPEVGIVDGFKPVFFSNEDREQLEHFIFGAVGSHIEFGAHQCILVRNEDAKERLLKQVGDVGLVLTIYESKGLEFNDVLLYDFFSDSVVGPSTWRVVLNAIKDWTNVGEKVPAPVFQNIRHASICTELKSLYVAITRARENVWIADGSDSGQSLRSYWTSRDLIRCFAPGSDAPKLATSSTPEEWATQGRELFDQKRYGPAKHCYIRAELPKPAAVAHAYLEREKARSTANTKQNQTARRNAFRGAGDAFLLCAEAETIATARQTYYRNSAACYEQANDLYHAASIYVLANNFNRAGEIYRDLKKWDESTAVVDDAREKMDPEVVNSIVKRARLAYFDAQDIVKGCSLFDSTDDALEYLEDRGLDAARANLLESIGQTVEAGEIHYTEGRRETAISLFLKDKSNVVGLQRALECVLEGLWQHCSFGIPPHRIRADPVATHLLSCCSQFNMVDLPYDDSSQLAMFLAIESHSTQDLVELGLAFYEDNNHAAALLCLDHAFAEPPQIANAPLTTVVQELDTFTIYTTLLSTVTFRADLTEDEDLVRLFGFSRVAENAYRISQPTWLHNLMARSRRSQEPEFQMASGELQLLVRTSLSAHLRARTNEASQACHESKAFSPCLSYVVFESCPRRSCPENHVAAKDIEPGSYNQRVRVHLQQILILQSLRANTGRETGQRGPRFWISRLYNALHPPHHSLGSIADLDVSKIPEAKKAFDVVKHCVQSLVLAQDLRPPRTAKPLSQTPLPTIFLTDVMRTASLALTFDRQRAARYLYQAPYWNYEPKPVELVQFKNFIVHDLIMSVSGLSLGAGASAISHVIRHEVPISVNILCHHIEYLCSSYILCSRAKVNNFHDVTVPKSWLLRYLKIDAEHFNPTLQTNNYMGLFKETFLSNTSAIGTLLEQMYLGGEPAAYLLYGSSRHLGDLPATTRNVFISRILRAICILGYNLRKTLVQESIVKIIKGLSKGLNKSTGIRSFPPLYRDYITAAVARGWEGIVPVVRRSLAKDPTDEMIRVLWQSKLRWQWTPAFGIRDIVYKTSHHEILHLLENRPENLGVAVPDSSLEWENAQQQQTAERDALARSAEVVEEDRPKEEEALPEVDEDDGGDQPDGHDEQREIVPSQESQVLQFHDIPEEEHAAARRIQQVYRRVTSRRRGILARTGMSGIRTQIYEVCARVAVSDWAYRCMFLGPVVHLLLCLDLARLDSLAHKKTTKNLLKGCPSEDYDSVDELLTQTNKAYKSIIKLQKDLAPTAEIHEQCDKAGLIKLVGDANMVLSSLPFKPSSDFSQDLALCVKGVLTVKSVRKPRPKPSLAVEDLDDLV